jgi:hypothetical protein
VPADIKAVYDHFGDAAKYKVATAGALPATGNWVGRTAFVEADKTLRVVTALPSTWEIVGSPETTETVVTFSSGLSAHASYPPVVTRRSNRVEITGLLSVTGATTLESLLTVTTSYRPSAVRFVGATSSSGSGVVQGMLHISTAGVLGMPSSYRAGSISVGDFLPVHGFWYL